MLLGHVGAAFAAKSFVKKLPLWMCIIAALLPDLISAALLPFHIESQTTFWSHSLLMNLIYCAAGFIIVFLVFKNISSSVLFSVLVFSHWLFDFISWPLEVMGINHGIPVFSSHFEIGLGLYRNVLPALICEFVLLGIGIAVFIIRKPKNLKITFQKKL